MDAWPHLSETRQGMILQRLAAVGERLAAVAAERAEEAKTAAEFKTYADAVAQLSRGVRMTLALEQRLVRDAFQLEASTRAERELQSREAVARRRQRLFDDLSGEVLREYEKPEWREDVLNDLHDRLEEEARLATFLEEPFEDQVERLKAVFDLGREALEEDEDGDDGDAEAADDDDSDEDDEPAAPEPSPIRWGGPPDDPFILGEITVINGPGAKPDSS